MARYYSSTNTYNTAGNVASVDITGLTLTMSAWINPFTLPAASIIFGKALAAGSPTQQQYQMYLSGGGTVPMAEVGDAAGRDTVTATGVTARLHEWMHLAVVKSPTLFSIFVNGKFVDSVASTRSIQNTTHHLMIGNRNGGDYPFNGRIAEAGIWDINLTHEQILRIYNGVYPPSLHPGRCRGFWSLIEPPISVGNARDSTRYNATMTSGGAIATYREHDLKPRPMDRFFFAYEEPIPLTVGGVFPFGWSRP